MRPLSAAILALLPVLAAACARTPIVVAPAPMPAAASPPAAAEPPSRPLVDNGPPCVVRLAEVRDVRSNPNDLGMMGPRGVHASDSVAWVQSALASLRQDRRLRFADTGADAQLVLHVDLVKAYILTQNSQKSSNVVIRVVYSRDGKDFDTQIARGRDDGVDWAFGEEEAQGSLNRALAAAVSELDQDIGAHCSAPR